MDSHHPDTSPTTAEEAPLHPETDQMNQEKKPPSQPQADEVNQEEPPKQQTRQCRICQEEVEPTNEEQTVVDQLRGKAPRKRYYTEGEGYLICPCKCTGSMKWVHEQCLQNWRYTHLGHDHHRQCYSCKEIYQLERIKFAQRLRSPILSFFITVAIMILSVFLLGFVADPILNLWLDPVGTIREGVSSLDLDSDELAILDDLGMSKGWFAHFTKGTLSLGVLGFVKAFVAMSPWQLWNLRSAGVVGGNGRRGNTGHDRLENISLALVVIGIVTFFWAVWKGTRAWTQRTLERTSEKIMNVQSDDDDEEEQAEAKKKNQ